MNITRIFCLLLILTSCNSEKKNVDEIIASEADTNTSELVNNPNKNLYWGDTHLHTNYSSDAFLFGTIMASPDEAFRFAKGEVMNYPPTGEKIQIKRPLDFLVVTDHAEGLGTMIKARNKDPLLISTQAGRNLAKIVDGDPGIPMFLKWLRAKNLGQRGLTEIDTGQVMRTIWADYNQFADDHDEPGKFSAFIGWEWTSTLGGFNLHRVLFTHQDASVANQFLPYSATHSPNPEDLWDWLDETTEKYNVDLISIPHNSNISGGLMFPNDKDSKGNPLDASYAKTRAKWEPIVEITQIKGTSEAHPKFSPTDEFANFELWNILIKTNGGNKAFRSNPQKEDFVRYALGSGLKLENDLGTNPYKFGIIGSSDTHTALSSVDEDNFTGKNLMDGGAADKSKPWIADIKHIDFSAAGYAAVWAESNTRKDIYDSFKRKEVYGTTGSRIQLRVFGGWEFDDNDIASADYVDRGYKKGVPMGGDLSNAGSNPLKLMIHAAKDPKGGNLDRVQVIKSWIEHGEPQEKVIDVAWSGDRKKNKDGNLSPITNTVDIEKATYTNSVGALELVTVWQDPNFDPNKRAVYYVRVIEIPTPRYSTFASAKMQQDPWVGAEPVVQERAYSSPIWYTP
ncbi:MAG: hypothetical protein ACJA01_001477 [Saprospiraceae bacterium]|jgi:hypothetical protein